MATYKELHGQAVKDESSDPTAAGEIFYNSSTNTFRSVIQTEAWRSQSPLSEGRSLAGTAGTSTAGLAFGGEPGPASPSYSELVVSKGLPPYTNPAVLVPEPIIL